MTEDFLHYIWKHKLYRRNNFYTHSGESLEIIHPGIHNSDSGPDFFNAKIKIDGTLWAGNVEIHLRASDWNRHNHHKDKAYNNVILHVVFDNDVSCFNSNKQEIPAYEISVEPHMIKAYQGLQSNQSWIPCSNLLKEISQFELKNWLDRMMIEKLEKKSDDIQKLLTQYRNDWEEVFYIMLVRNFGFGLNGDVFEQLARQTPWRIIKKNSHDINRLEAIFLGQGGFLSDLLPEDDYIKMLQREYSMLSKLYGLKAVPLHNWKFLRLRPSNFPTIRLVQLAAIFKAGKMNFSKVIEARNPKELKALFNQAVSKYWHKHYRPGAESPFSKKSIGDSSKELLIINTFVPFVFIYGKNRGNEQLCDLSFNWLKGLKPEKNSIINNFMKAGIEVNNSAHSQALVHLYQNYCRLKKCLHCRIGHLLIANP